MHELSLADALAGQVRRHLPPQSVARVVVVRAGPLRGIEPQTLQWGWQAVIRQTDLDGCRLQLELVPWDILCLECGRQFTSNEPFADCDCGSAMTRPAGGDELLLMSIEAEMNEAGTTGEQP